MKDVAEISYKSEVVHHITRINGHRCILVSAGMKDNVNISDVQKEYLPLIDEFSKELPSNIKLVKNFDQADMVSKRLGHLGFDFGLAIILVIVTLLPLGSRASVIVMISIPLSLAIGLAGLGNVGAGVYKNLERNGDLLAERTGHRLKWPTDFSITA